MTQNESEQAVQQKIDEVFQEMDKNHDEKISLQEFIESASQDRSLISVLELNYDIQWRHIYFCVKNFSKRFMGNNADLSKHHRNNSIHRNYHFQKLFKKRIKFKIQSIEMLYWLTVSWNCPLSDFFIWKPLPFHK